MYELYEKVAKTKDSPYGLNKIQEERNPFFRRALFYCNYGYSER